MKQLISSFLLMLWLLSGSLLAQEIGSEKDTSKNEKGALYKALAFTVAYYAISD